MSADLRKALREAMRKQTESLAPVMAVLRKQVRETTEMWRKYQ